MISPRSKEFALTSSTVTETLEFTYLKLQPQSDSRLIRRIDGKQSKCIHLLFNMWHFCGVECLASWESLNNLIFVLTIRIVANSEQVVSIGVVRL